MLDKRGRGVEIGVGERVTGREGRVLWQEGGRGRRGEIGMFTWCGCADGSETGGHVAGLEGEAVLSMCCGYVSTTDGLYRTCHCFSLPVSLTFAGTVPQSLSSSVLDVGG
jgi:hypothetical protein